MDIALSWMTFILFWVFLYFKSYDIITKLSWWIKKKNRSNNKVLELKIKIIDSLSKELNVKIKSTYTSHQFFEFKYDNNKFQLYFPDKDSCVSVSNKTTDIYKSFNYYDLSLYLDLLSFIKKSSNDKPKEIEVRNDYYGL